MFRWAEMAVCQRFAVGGGGKFCLGRGLGFLILVWERKRGRKRKAVRGRTAIEELEESAFGAEPGGLLRNPMPSMPSRRGYVSFAGPKESNQRKGPGCGHPVPRSRAKSLIKTGRLHSRKSNVPASPSPTSSTNFARATQQKPPYPFCHALSPVLKGLTAGLRKVFPKGQCGLASFCLPQRPTIENATAKSCREKLRG